MKRSVKPNKKYTFRVSGLDLTSLGSPQNTEVGVYATALVKGKPVQVKLGEFPGQGRAGEAELPHAGIRFSQLSVVAEPSRHHGRHLPRPVQPPDQGQAAAGDLQGAQARDRRQDQDLRQHRGQGARHAAQGLGRGQDRQEAVQGQAGRRQGRRSSCRSSRPRARSSSRSSTSAARTSSAPTSSSTCGWSAEASQPRWFRGSAADGLATSTHRTRWLMVRALRAFETTWTAARSAHRAGRRAQPERRLHQRQVAERLREVADHPLRRAGSYSSESSPTSLTSPTSRSNRAWASSSAAGGGVRRDQPERAGQERDARPRASPSTPVSVR